MISIPKNNITGTEGSKNLYGLEGALFLDTEFYGPGLLEDSHDIIIMGKLMSLQELKVEYLNTHVQRHIQHANLEGFSIPEDKIEERFYEFLSRHPEYTSRIYGNGILVRARRVTIINSFIAGEHSLENANHIRLVGVKTAGGYFCEGAKDVRSYPQFEHIEDLLSVVNDNLSSEHASTLMPTVEAYLKGGK